MKIGIIGTGNIGKTLATLWAQAGHQLILSSRHPKELNEFAKNLNNNAIVGTPEEAAMQGEIILMAIPLGEVLNLSPAVKKALEGKVVMDANNPYPERDGESGEEALNSIEGSGVWTSQHLPGAIIVKAFNSVYYKELETKAHQKNTPGIPLASDNETALKIVSDLVTDAGFSPLIVGNLKLAKEFDNGSPAYNTGATAIELKEILGVKTVGKSI